MVLPHPSIASAGPQLGRAVTVLPPRPAPIRASADGDAGAPLALSHGLHPRAVGISATSALAAPGTRQGRAPLTVGF